MRKFRLLEFLIELDVLILEIPYDHCFRDEAGWTMARKLQNGSVVSEGYIPTTYYEIIQD